VLAVLALGVTRSAATAAVVPLPRVSAATSVTTYRGKPTLRVNSLLVRRVHGALAVSCNRCRRLKTKIRITRPTSTSKRFTGVSWLLGTGRAIKVTVVRRGSTGRFLMLSARTSGNRRGLVFQESGCLDRRRRRVRCPRGTPQPAIGAPVPATTTAPPPPPPPPTTPKRQPRAATPGVVRDGHWYLSDTFGDPTTHDFAYGNPGDFPIVGDWNGDGTDTPGVVRSGHWYLTDTFGDPTTHDFAYGNPGDFPIVGDWNGDGTDTPGVVRSGHWYLTDTFGDPTTHDFAYGNPGDFPIVGDWNGDGTDTPGVVRSGHWYLTDTFGDPTTHDFAYGNPGDIPVVGTRPPR
jgi:hypothetical protein